MGIRRGWNGWMLLSRAVAFQRAEVEVEADVPGHALLAIIVSSFESRPHCHCAPVAACRATDSAPPSARMVDHCARTTCLDTASHRNLQCELSAHLHDAARLNER